MSEVAISDALRATIRERAGGHCEYCLMPDSFAFVSYEIDHVVARKHGGKTEVANLAYACQVCNRYKGTDLTSIDPSTGNISVIFNPRRDNWADHFRIEVAAVIPLTAIGRATVSILRLDKSWRLTERKKLFDLGMLLFEPL